MLVQRKGARADSREWDISSPLTLLQVVARTSLKLPADPHPEHLRVIAVKDWKCGDAERMRVTVCPYRD